jgi:serine/threonine-protein kinase
VAGAPPDANGASQTGALLLPAAEVYEDEQAADEDGPGIRRVVLWSLLAALIVGAVVAAVLLLSASKTHVSVPSVAGQSEQSAIARLREAGLQPVASSAPSASVASGRVISQSPSAGSRASSGSDVTIVVSSGPGSAALGSYEGLSEAQAINKLRAAGFKPSRKEQPSAKIAEGKVIGTEPPAGTELQVGSPVVVLVSSGPAQVHVPDVSGDSQSGAESALSAVGLSVGTVTQQVSSTQSAGSVIAQSPAAGSSVGSGTKVDLTVAKAASEVAVPSVVGQTETQAAATLGAAGFSPSVVTAATLEESKVGVVLAQSPAAGKNARKGSTVTLRVGTKSTETTSTPTTTTPTTTTPTTTTPPASAG